MKRTLTVDELHEYFVNQRIKGFTWDRLVHHPISREEAEQLWNEVSPALIEALGHGVRKNPSDTFASIPVGTTFNFQHETNWLDIAKGPWCKVGPKQYVQCGTTEPKHSVGKPSSPVCVIKKNPSKSMAKNRNTDALALIGLASNNEHMAIYDYIREMNQVETELAIEYIQNRIESKKDLSPNAGFILGQVYYALQTSPSLR